MLFDDVPAGDVGPDLLPRNCPTCSTWRLLPKHDVHRNPSPPFSSEIATNAAGDVRDRQCPEL
jgi:hypothetical protein